MYYPTLCFQLTSESEERLMEWQAEKERAKSMALAFDMPYPELDSFVTYYYLNPKEIKRFEFNPYSYGVVKNKQLVFHDDPETQKLKKLLEDKYDVMSVIDVTMNDDFEVTVIIANIEAFLHYLQMF